MKKYLLAIVCSLAISVVCFSQVEKSVKVPSAVNAAFSKMFPDSKNVTWEKEKGNYEANWGGKSKEDNSVMFKPDGTFIEKVKAIPISQLPSSVLAYVNKHKKGANITEAGLVTNADGKITYEVEVNKKDLIFDEKGSFLKKD